MIKNEKNIFKLFLLSGMVILIIILVFSMAQVWVFLSVSRANESLFLEVKDTPDTYTSKLIWLPDEPVERPMEDFTRDILKRDYIRALYQRNMALLTGDTLLIQDYYTALGREKIKKFMSQDKSIIKEHIELEHQLQLNYYSADGQIIGFLDKATIETERIWNKEKHMLAYDTDTLNYQVIMILEDGYWRIHNMKQVEVVPELPKVDTVVVDFTKAELLSKIMKAKGINYYPQDAPFKDFWINYDSAQVEKDFMLIKKLKFNSVRVFINFEQFGKGLVIPEMMERLHHLLDVAEYNNVSVILTLFDFNSDFNLFNFPATDRHLETILTALRFHPALIGYDLKNEPDIDYNYQDERLVNQWLEFVISKARIYDPVRPMTIGWSNANKAIKFKDRLDFISFHFYKNPNILKDDLKFLKKNAPDKNVVVSEYGKSTYLSKIFPFGNSKNSLFKELLKVHTELEKNHVPSYFWTLYDFKEVASDVAGKMPWQKNPQKYFGLIEVDGKPKDALKIFEYKSQSFKPNIIERIPPFVVTYILLGVVFVIFILYLDKLKRFIIYFINKRFKGR